MPTSWLHADIPHHTIPYTIPYRNLSYHVGSLCPMYGFVLTLTTIHTIHTIPHSSIWLLSGSRVQKITYHTYHTCHTWWGPYVYFMASLCSLPGSMHTCHITTYHMPCRPILYHTVPYGIHMSTLCHLCFHTMSTIPHGTHISTAGLYAYIPYHTIHPICAIPVGILMSPL